MGAYLHSKRVYHRDLKPDNILVNRDASIKLCDFNMARVVDDESGSPQLARQGSGSPPPMLKMRRDLTTRVCTPQYRPPEVLLCLKYTEAMDVWAVGCIFVEVFTAINENRVPNTMRLFQGRQSWPLSGAHSAG